MVNKIIRTHKVRIYPDRNQEELLRKSCGVKRFAFNWALNEWDKLYRSGEKPSAYSIRNEFVKLKKHEGYSWLKEVSKETYANAILEMGEAWKKYFKRLSKGKPKFKSKRKSKDSYKEVSNSKGYLKWIGKKLYFPKFRKSNHMVTGELPRFNGELKSIVISRQGDKWYASCTFELEKVPLQYKRHKHKVDKVGIDLGVKTLATLSDSRIFKQPNVKPIEKKISKQQRRLSKKVKNSKNYLKAKTKLQRLYFRKQNILKDNLHKVTNFVVRHYNNICLEDLSASNMIKNHKLAKSITNAQFYEFRRQIEYKTKNLKQGGVDINVLFADRYFPSSKTCSKCGCVKDTLSLSTRTYVCEHCGHIMDRDLNAAKNLERLIA